MTDTLQLFDPGPDNHGRSTVITSRGRRITATYSAGTRCDGRCMNATGPDCECSCNGRNHGIHS